MKKVALALAVLICTATPVLAVPVANEAIDVAHTFGFNGTLTNTAHKVTFGTINNKPIMLSTVSVINLSATAGTYIFVQTNGTTASGSTAEIQLGPGQSYTYQGTALPSISVYSAGTSVPYSVGGN
jgi:adenylosuccinate synthase